MSICVECGSWNSKTLATRKDTRFNWTWRRKECKDCGHQWKTYEIPVENLGQVEPSNPEGRLDQ